MTKANLTFPAFSVRFHSTKSDFRVKFDSGVSLLDQSQVKFDSGVSLLDQSQFVAMHSNQCDCFILYRQPIMSNYYLPLNEQRPGFRVALKDLK